MTKYLFLTDDNSDRVMEEVKKDQLEKYIIVVDGNIDPGKYKWLADCTVVKYDKSSFSAFNGIHPRMAGMFPQYTGTDVGLGENLTYSFVVKGDTPLKNWEGKEWRAEARYGPLSSEEYVGAHNHTQGLLVEGWNFSNDVNTIAIWGDTLAARSHAKVWGGFLSARSHLLKGWHPYTPPLSASEPGVFDAQLIGLEIDVLNGGLNSGERTSPEEFPLAKNGLQVVGFGARNSAAIEVRCEDSDDTSRDENTRRGTWDYIFVARNAVHDRSTFICSGFTRGYRGIDLGSTLYSDGAVRIKSQARENGIQFNEGKSSIYVKDDDLYIENLNGNVNIVSNKSSSRPFSGKILQSYAERNRHDNLKDFLLYYRRLGASYSYIPKNGCTTLKLSLGVSNGTLAPDASPHGLERQFITHSLVPHLKARSFIVFRDPFKRAVSAYLDKIAKPFESFGWDVCSAILINQRRLSADQVKQVIEDGETPTFSEFINYLVSRSDDALNEHWRSQCSFYSLSAYTRIFSLEGFDEQWIASGFSDIPLITSRAHATVHGRAVSANKQEFGSETHISDMRGGPLRKFMEAGRVPSTELFFENKEVREKFCLRYADDIVVYRELFTDKASSILYKWCAEEIV